MHLSRIRPFSVGSLLLAALLAGAPASAEAPALLSPAPHQDDIARIVATLLTFQHYSHHDLDDAMSARWFDGYLESLDPGRIYFLQSDIDAFSSFRTALDDTALVGEPRLDVAFDLFNRYRQRVDERLADVTDLLDDPIDLTVPETFDLDRSDDPWPETRDEAKELWRLRVKDAAVRAEVNGTDRATTLTAIANRNEEFRKALADQDATDVLELFLGALATSYDPHTAYFGPVTKADFEIQVSDSLEGIGAVLETDGEYTRIKELVVGGPAARTALLNPGDRIVAVAQGSADPVDVVGLRIDRVVKLIRGDKGSEVRLTILPAGRTGETRVVPIVRDEVLLEEQAPKATIREVDGQKLGIIEVPSFVRGWDPSGRRIVRSTTADVRKLLDDLRAQHVTGLVIDLRRNGGGALDEAVDLTGLFIDKGPVVQVRDLHHGTETLDDVDRGEAWDGPLVVLTSQLSASASEIFAGALQDYDRALVVGAPTTHGKGTVQRILAIDPMLRRVAGVETEEDIGGGLKITFAKFYRVSGGSTQSRGVAADIVVPSALDAYELGEAKLDYALDYDEIPEVRYRRYDLVKRLVPALRERSTARIEGDARFQKLKKELERLTEESKRTTVSLDLATRRKQSASPVDEEGAEAPKKDDDPVLDEAMWILDDYIHALHGT